MFSKRKLTLIVIALSLAIFAAGCKKKAPAPPPPPPPAPAPAPPPPAAPTVAQFTAEPTSIQRGQSSTLRWEVTGNVTSVSIDNAIGTVQATGTRRVFPTDSITYTLTASGPGGNTTATATISVTAPPPPPPPPPPPAPTKTLSERLSEEVKPIYFDYDKSDIRADAQQTLNADAGALKSILNDFPNATITVAGNCDARGSAEYNLGLGDRRSAAAKDFLVGLGVPGDRLRTVSYGKEHANPNCSDDACWQQDRNAQFSAGQ
jgi:peptidoglycan-associated lipoprotein